MLAFAAFLVACSAGATWFITPPLIWIARRTEHVIRVDWYSQLVAATAATAIMLRSIDRRPWSDLALGRASLRARAMFTGWTVGMGANAFTCLALLAASLLAFAPAPIEGSWPGAAFRVTLVLLPAALAEEMVCRGYLLTVVRDCVGTPAAVVLTSVLFGVLHLNNPGATVASVLVVIVSGVLLATVRLRLNSLYAAWMAHLAWNWTMSVPFHALVSGIRFEAPGYRAVTAEPAWLSGGAWGPEGGLVAAIGMMLGLAYFYARRRREES
ncbi:MAG: CPBP family intramembrane glutamic endopeptidase [bacterium]